jgi:hypothetical protein
MIDIEHVPSQAATQVVYIKMNGERYDARSRSASPRPFNRHSQNHDYDGRQDLNGQGDNSQSHEQVIRFAQLPPSIDVWHVPHVARHTGRMNWTVQIRPYHLSSDTFVHKTLAYTDTEPVWLDTLDLGRRVLEKDVSCRDLPAFCVQVPGPADVQIIPRLCEYLVDVIDVIPPKTKAQGWLITVDGPHAARKLMNVSASKLLSLSHLAIVQTESSA